MTEQIVRDAGIGPCEQLRKQFRRSTEALARERRRATALRSEIANLQAEPEPDEERIAVLQKGLDDLVEQINEDQAALTELDQFILENCGPNPDE